MRMDPVSLYSDVLRSLACCCRRCWCWILAVCRRRQQQGKKVVVVVGINGSNWVCLPMVWYVIDRGLERYLDSDWSKKW